MKARPKSAPSVILEFKAKEAEAVCRALNRALERTPKTENLDVQRLSAVRGGLCAALDGGEHEQEVES